MVSRALSMVSQYTSKVKDEQIFRQTLWKAMKTVKQEQTALVSFLAYWSSDGDFQGDSESHLFS